MIELLKWDSEFFNLKIGRLSVSKDFIFDSNAFKNYDLIYIFSPNRLPHLANHFEDNKLVYYIDSHNCTVDNDVLESGKLQDFDKNIHSYQDLINLAYESGKYSRFKLDPGFKKETFYRFYEKWLFNSIEQDFADYNMVLSMDNNQLIGFVTLKVTSNNWLQIQLISVSSAYQGMGYGKVIMNNIFNMAKELNCDKITVATQFRNLAARKFYESLGFEKLESTYIYHLWKK